VGGDDDEFQLFAYTACSAGWLIVLRMVSQQSGVARITEIAVKVALLKLLFLSVKDL